MRHYVRIIDLLKEWTAKISGESKTWAEELFADITEEGKCISYYQVPPRKDQPNIILCGNIYICEVAPDRSRDDTLFIFRVNDARRRLPTVEPRRYQADFKLIKGTTNAFPYYDTASHLFEVATARREGRNTAPLSSKTREWLCKTPEKIRAQWIQYGEVMPPDNKDDFLEILRWPWGRFRLDRFRRRLSIAPRYNAILAGVNNPEKLTEIDRMELLYAFDESLLNGYIESCAKIEDFHTFLEHLAKLPLHPFLRARVWHHMLRGLSPKELKIELHRHSRNLRSIVADDDLGDWQAPIVELINAIATEHQDRALKELYDDAAYSKNPLQVIIGWAELIQVAERTSAEPEREDKSPEVLKTLTETEKKAIGQQEEEAEDEPSRSASSEQEQGKTRQQEFEHAEGGNLIDRWILRLQIPDLKNLQEIREYIAGYFSNLRDLASSEFTVSAVIDLGESLRDLKSSLDDWSASIPDAELLKEDYRQALGLFERARELLGDNLPLLLEHRISPADLSEFLEIFENHGELERLPNWFWRLESGMELSGDKAADHDRILALLNSKTRTRVKSILSATDKYDPKVRNAFSSLPPPPDYQDHADYLDLEMEKLSALNDAVNLDREGIGAAIDQYLDDGSGLGSIIESLAALSDMKKRVSANTYKETLEEFNKVVSLGDTRQFLDRVHLAIEFAEDNFGSAKDLSFGQIQAWISKNAQGVDGGAESSNRRHPFMLTHNFVDAEARKTPIVYYESLNEPYGYIKIPALLFSDRKRDVQLKIKMEVTSGQRDLWLEYWENPSPEDLSIPISSWRSQRGDSRYFYTFTLKVPLREPKGKCELKVSLTEKGSRNLAAPIKAFSWDEVLRDPPKAVLDWTNKVVPQFVDKHPIGPQQYVGEIISNLRAGESFAACAPRRYGKSTLAYHLKEYGESAGLEIVGPIDCARYCTRNIINYEDVWGSAAAQLKEKYHAQIDLVLEKGLPTAEAFDHIRTAAKANGVSTIAILFDEAQVLFPKSTGHETGDHLKNYLTLKWAEDEGKSSVAVGLIGLPSLPERAGTNLFAALREYESYTFDDSTMKKLISIFTKGAIHTTREARQLLIEKSKSVLILKALLGRLVVLVNRENKRWVSFDDVMMVISELKQELRNGRAARVSSYLRDTFNEAESINDWLPKPSFPVAVALAMSKSKGHTEWVEQLEDMRLTLSAWCDDVAGESFSKPIYVTSRVEEHLRDLEEIGVLKGRRFQSDLVEAWLAGVGERNLIADEKARIALIEGAIMRVRLTEPLEPVAGGGEASISLFSGTDGLQYAVRKVVLNSELDRKRFVETLEVLRKLSHGVHLRKAGSDYIFDLQEVGLLEADSSIAAMVYRWVDGVDLERSVGSLSPTLVAEIGRRLAIAVKMLHSIDVIHRDIHPKNVILSDEAAADGGIRPILIDFGLARLATSSMVTQIGHHYSAPEVSRSSPQWTTAADIYSLGCMLSSLLRRDEHGVLLEECLRAAMSNDPKMRPMAGDLVESFSEICRKMDVMHLRDVAWETVVDVAGGDAEKPWFLRVLKKFRGRFEGISLGLYVDAFDRCAEMADLFNQTLEANPGERMSLGRMKRDVAFSGKRTLGRNMEIMHSLRVWRSHGKVEKEHLLKRFELDSEDDLILLTIEVGGEVGGMLGLSNLDAIAESILM